MFSFEYACDWFWMGKESGGGGVELGDGGMRGDIPVYTDGKRGC